jgi:hypothetical protein
MKNKIGLGIGIIVIALVCITLAFYLANITTFELVDIVLPIITLLILISAVYILWDKAKNIRKGLPAKDERLINNNYKAGYYGFIAAIWSAVLAPALSDIILKYELEGHHITAIVVLTAGIVFIISYLYFAWKGK